jgi:hypothetical protein
VTGNGVVRTALAGGVRRPTGFGDGPAEALADLPVAESMPPIPLGAATGLPGKAKTRSSTIVKAPYSSDISPSSARPCSAML